MPSAGFLISAIEPAIILALLGSVDSLLTSLIADSLTGTQHNPDKELVGQGLGNIVAGLFGSVSYTFDTLQILRRVPEGRIVGTLDQVREIAAGLLDDRAG